MNTKVAVNTTHHNHTKLFDQFQPSSNLNKNYLKKILEKSFKRLNIFKLITIASRLVYVLKLSATKDSFLANIL